MTRTAAEAVKAAKATTTNKPGMCQQVTRGWLGAGSAGDQDGDGDADAVDGWKSEPVSARHSDRKPPVGAPLAWSGGSGGFGHRALCIGYSGGQPLIRSTDAAGRGRVGNHTLGWFEQNWGLNYLGWSETITGQPIPGLKIQSEPKPGRPSPPKPKYSRGKAVDHAIADLRKAKAKPGSLRAERIEHALSHLTRVPLIK